MASLYKDCSISKRTDDSGRFFHILSAFNFCSRKGFRFRNIRSQYLSQRKEFFHQSFSCPFHHKGAAAGGYHHRVDHNIFCFILSQFFCNDLDDLLIGNHADLHRIRINIPENTIQLFPHEFRGSLFHSINTGCVLGCKGGYSCHSVHFMGRYGFDIRLDPGPSTGI